MYDFPFITFHEHATRIPLYVSLNNLCLPKGSFWGFWFGNSTSRHQLLSYKSTQLKIHELRLFCMKPKAFLQICTHRMRFLDYSILHSLTRPKEKLCKQFAGQFNKKNISALTKITEHNELRFCEPQYLKGKTIMKSTN